MADGIRATPYSSSFAGTANDLIGGLLGYMRDPRRTQQMQGLAGLLEGTGIPKTVERLAYGEPLTNIRQANVPTLRPETANALMTLLPVPSGASKAARAIDPAVQKYGPRLEQSLLPAFEAAYNRGGLTREMVEAMGTNTKSLLDVWHGSPHGPFNKFDPSKARTGEGNASYGEGAYLAEARGTGEAYRKQLSDFDISVDGKPFNADDISHLAAMSVTQAGGNKTKALETLSEAVKDLKSRNVKWADDLANEKQKEIDYLTQAKEIPKYEEESKGYLYKVDLPDEAIPKMLDWDKPLSQQTPEVRQALEQLGYQVDKAKVSEYEDALLNALLNDGSTDLPKQPLDLSGEAVYTKLKRSFANNERLNAERDALIGKYQKEGMSWSQAVRAMSPEDRSSFVDIANKIETQKNAGLMASEELQKLGITGIRYLDEASRGLGQGTSNFVVFPQYQDLLTIKEINDMPVKKKQSLLD